MNEQKLATFKKAFEERTTTLRSHLSESADQKGQLISREMDRPEK